VNCGGAKTTYYTPDDPNADASVHDSVEHVDCGRKAVKRYKGEATAVTVLMSSLDGKCSAAVWGGTGPSEGPGGTAGKSALHDTLEKDQLYTFQNPKELYGYCLGEGKNGCEFKVVAAEYKTP